ncbi:MAG: sugar ABC transporter permease [Paenibacillaceae bacterium]|nr:sugar ABC transporter permease [Paenibacillaceae bacterium]
MPLHYRDRAGRLRRTFSRYGYYYLMLVPAMLGLIVFDYIPIYGVLIAFKDFRFIDGVLGSPWVGFKHFAGLFESVFFWRVLKNTLVISALKLVIGFPAPIVLAILFNELARPLLKKVVQTISYLPHFMSWVILAGIVNEILSPQRGALNYILSLLGIRPIYFLAEPGYFVGVLIGSHVWQTVGWGSIIYLAAISAINQDQFESARIDGASRFQQIRHITLPSLVPVVTIVFILQLGQIMNAGFDQIFNLYNPIVYGVADIIDTYVYRMGLEKANYSFSTAVGLFKNAIGLVLVLGTNYLVKRFNEYGIW